MYFEVHINCSWVPSSIYPEFNGVVSGFENWIRHYLSCPSVMREEYEKIEE